MTDKQFQTAQKVIAANQKINELLQIVGNPGFDVLHEQHKKETLEYLQQLSTTLKKVYDEL